MQAIRLFMRKSFTLSAMNKYPAHEPVKHRTWYYKFHKDDKAKKLVKQGKWYIYEYGEDVIACHSMRQVRLDMTRLKGYFYSQLDYVNEPVVKKYKPF